jgi:hypothetical protein
MGQGRERREEDATMDLMNNKTKLDPDGFGVLK